MPARLTAMILAAGLALPAAAQTPTSLEKAGWVLVTGTEDVNVYMRNDTKAASGLRRVWTAYDSAGPRKRDGFTFRSVRSLGEFDCQKRVSRIVDEFFHAGPALQGRSWRSPKFTVTPWAPAAPDSIGAVRMAYACKTLADI